MRRKSIAGRSSAPVNAGETFSAISKVSDLGQSYAPLFTFVDSGLSNRMGNSPRPRLKTALSLSWPSARERIPAFFISLILGSSMWA